MKSPQQTPQPGELVVRPSSNGGALRYGSRPGNTPGTGRPKDAIRAKLRKITRKSIGEVERIAMGLPVMQQVRDKDGQILEQPVVPTLEHRIKAMEVCLRYGVGIQEKIEHSGAVGSYVAVVPAKAAKAETWAKENGRPPKKLKANGKRG